MRNYYGGGAVGGAFAKNPGPGRGLWGRNRWRRGDRLNQGQGGKLSAGGAGGRPAGGGTCRKLSRGGA